MSAQLEDEEILGLKIMALLHTGELQGLDCGRCNEPTQIEVNCKGGEQDESVFADPFFRLELTSCPFNYIPDNIKEFITEYYFYPDGDFSGSFSHKKINGRKFTAIRAYKNFIATVMNIKFSKNDKQ
jgi:hypothetical protein